MNIEEIRVFCIQKKAVTEGFPFDETTLVFKVKDKIFALLNLHGDTSINLKNQPEKNIDLREQYPAIIPGYHMNKKHWNTVNMDGSVSAKLLKQLIDESYQIVVDKLPKKLKEELNS